MLNPFNEMAAGIVDRGHRIMLNLLEIVEDTPTEHTLGKINKLYAQFTCLDMFNSPPIKFWFIRYLCLYFSKVLEKMGSCAQNNTKLNFA